MLVLSPGSGHQAMGVTGQLKSWNRWSQALPKGTGEQSKMGTYRQELAEIGFTLIPQELEAAQKRLPVYFITVREGSVGSGLG